MPEGSFRNQASVKESKYSNWAKNPIVRWVHSYIDRNKRPIKMHLSLSKVEYKLMKEAASRAKCPIGTMIRGCALAAASMYLEARNEKYRERRHHAIATTDAEVFEALGELDTERTQSEPYERVPPDGVLEEGAAASAGMDNGDDD